MGTASVSNNLIRPAKSAIFAKIGGKLATLYLTLYTSRTNKILAPELDRSTHCITIHSVPHLWQSDGCGRRCPSLWQSMAGVEISHIGAEPTQGCDGAYVRPEACSSPFVFKRGQPGNQFDFDFLNSPTTCEDSMPKTESLFLLSCSHPRARLMAFMRG